MTFYSLSHSVTFCIATTKHYYLWHSIVCCIYNFHTLQHSVLLDQSVPFCHILYWLSSSVVFCIVRTFYSLSHSVAFCIILYCYHIFSYSVTFCIIS